MLEDILFRNRNKDYGAWQIRKKYRKTTWIALLISAIVFIFIFSLPLILNFKKQYFEPVELPPVKVTLEMFELQIEEPKLEEMPKQKKTNKPIIEEKTNKEEEKSTTEQADTVQQNEEPQEQKPTPPSDPRLLEEARFSCGGNLNDFRNWFMQQFALPESIVESQKELKILIRFMVNKQGLIDSFAIDKEIDPIIFDKIESILFNAPRWEPCLYEGNEIKQKYTMPVYIMPSKVLN